MVWLCLPQHVVDAGPLLAVAPDYVFGFQVSLTSLFPTNKNDDKNSFTNTDVEHFNVFFFLSFINLKCFMWFNFIEHIITKTV